MATKLFGVMGWPIHHSASPAMMKAAFQALSVDAVYLPFAVRPDDFQIAVQGLEAIGAAGVNVTIPHKQAAWREMTRLTPQAELAQAVNTVAFLEDGTRTGHNTDVDGWWNSVEASVGTGSYTVVVFGNGGAARAVLAALSLYNPSARVRVIARDEAKSAALVSGFRHLISVTTGPWERRMELCLDARFIVNTTPVGMWPHTAESVIPERGCFSAGQVVQDVVYRPALTRFLQLAAEQGAVTIGGLPMLAGQGAAALEFWLHRKGPIEVMLAAAEAFVTAEDKASEVK